MSCVTECSSYGRCSRSLEASDASPYFKVFLFFKLVFQALQAKAYSQFITNERFDFKSEKQDFRDLQQLIKSLNFVLAH